MSYLTLDADRLVRDAVEAFLVGRLRPDPLPDTVYATKNSRYRIIAGLVHEASDTSLMGAELVGWLLEEYGSARVEPRWRTSSRGVFVERKSGHVVVTSRVLTRSVVSESGRPRSGMHLSAIPPAPPIPQLKQAPSIAPPSLISMGAPDPLPPRRTSRPPMPSDEEVTKVERTEVADLDELDALREISASTMPPPAPDAVLDGAAQPAGSEARHDAAPPSGDPQAHDRLPDSLPDSLPDGLTHRFPSGLAMGLPDDLDAETRPAVAALPEASRRSQPPPPFAGGSNGVPSARPSPRLVPPRAQSNRPPPPRPSVKKNAPAAAGSKRGAAPPAPSSKKAAPPPAPSSKNVVPPPAPASKKGLPPPAPSSRKGVPPPPPPSSTRNPPLNPLPPPNPPPRKTR